MDAEAARSGEIRAGEQSTQLTAATGVQVQWSAGGVADIADPNVSQLSPYP
jgi:hypothetical protein